MDAKIIFSRIIQRLLDQGHAQVFPLNYFGLIAIKANSVLVSRENGLDTSIPFSRLELAIKTFQQNPKLYSNGPNALRPFGITHLNSPIYALLHLLPYECYLM